MSTTSTCHFMDGAACGVQLHLERTPLFLRVGVGLTGNFKGKVRALSEANAEGLVSEALYVYKISGMYDRSGRSRNFTYSLYKNQPTQAIMRDVNAWHDWATKEYVATEQVEVFQLPGVGEIIPPARIPAP